jgi:hypothetical protein
MATRAIASLIPYSTVVIVTLATLALGRSVAQTSNAELGDDVEFDFPGLGPVRLGDFAPEIRDKVRVPGIAYDEPAPVYRDLPPTLHAADDDIPPPTPGYESSPGNVTVQELPPPISPEERREREEAVKQLFPRDDGEQLQSIQRYYDEQRQQAPADAYLKAFEQLQRLQAPTPEAAAEPPEPQSWFPELRNWFAAAQTLWPAPALAQTPSCSNPSPWTLIGPAPFTLPGASTTKNSGIVNAIAVDPRNSLRAVQSIP